MVSGAPGQRILPSVVTVAFGTTVSMWALGYFGRLPALMLPSPLLLAALLGAVVAGGAIHGRHTGLGFRGGAAVGLTVGLLNLMVLGSFLEETSGAGLWLPGVILGSALLAGLGGALGTALMRAERPFEAWLSGYAKVVVAATWLLLGVGGLVTSHEAGLAVTDWPNSFGYNMFLYPFSRMTGGIYYEHAHRLFGALVGLTTLVFAIFLQRAEPRPWVRRLGWLALAMVIVQGILGGLRVTGGFTLATEASAMTPSVALAMVHGVFGQVFFATVVALAVVTSTTWRNRPEPLVREGVRTDRAMAVGLVALMIGQLVLGASQRHFAELLMIHIVTGVALVTPLVLHVGIRSWGLNRGQPVLQRLGLALLVGITLQIVLGFGAFAAGALRPTLDVTLSTAHQWFGAVLLALGTATMCWNFKLLGVQAGDAPARDSGAGVAPGRATPA